MTRPTYDHPPVATFFGPDEEALIPAGAMGGQPQQQTQKQREPKEDENNLQSLSFGRILDLVSEGPIVGLCTRAGVPITKHALLGQGVYLNGTAMISPSGKANFNGVSVGQKFGYQNQPPMDGFLSAEETISVSNELKHDQPLTVTIDNSDTSSVNIAIRIPTLFEQIKETGDVVGSVVQINFAVSLRGGAFTSKGALVVAGKTQSDFIKEVAITLPKTAGDPDGDFWAIRVSRATKDSDTLAIQNTTFLEYFTRIVGAKLRYPMCAYAGTQFNAAAFPSIPERAYSMKGRIIKVPSNYFPEKRAYTRNPVTGADTHTEQPWDGTFRTAWTDNPAWAFYDICVNPRYGLGEFLEGMDKWSLYQIAKYCDGKVRNPVNGRLEPRFTCNLYLQERAEAVKVLTDMASIFRGMTYWGNGSIIAIQDAPKDPVAVFTNANVRDGRFVYSGTPRGQRHTVAIVRWNDPKDFYAPKFEYVPDQDGIARYGVRELELVAMGCTRRGQAIRFGKWGLATELIQTRMVTFVTGLEGAFPRPGDIVEVQDQDLAGVRHGGRLFLIGDDRKSVVIDKAIAIDGTGFKITLVSPHAFTPPGETIPDSTYIGGIRPSQLLHRDLTNTIGTTTDTLTFTEALPEGVVRGSLWSISSTAVQVQLFRIMGVDEQGSHEYEIQAVEHNPGKFEAIENNIRLEVPAVTRIPDFGNIAPITELKGEKGYTDAPEGLSLWVQLTWKAPYDASLRSFVIEWRRDGGNWDTAGEVTANAYKFGYTEKGLYEFRVYAVNLLGVRSSAVTITIDVPNTNPLPALQVNGLELVGPDGAGQGNLTNFEGPDAKFRWRANSALRSYELGGEPLGANIGQDDPYFHHYECRVFDPTSGAQVWTEIVKVQNFTFTREHNAEAFGGTPRNRFRFEVVVVDKYNTASDAAVLIVQNPSPGTPSGLTVDAAFRSVFLSWVNPPDRDLALIRIKSTANDPLFAHAAVLAEVAAGTSAWAHTGVNTGTVYRYWLEAVDTFGNVSNPTGAAAGTPGTVGNSDIGAFAVDVTQMFTNTIALRGDAWTNNSPAAGRVAWGDHRLIFRGVNYIISAGNTPATHRYVWWKGPVFDADGTTLLTAGENVYRTAVSHPKDTPDLMAVNDFIIATNTEGIVDMAWRAIANAVIGSAYIAALAVKDGHIESLTAEKITAGIIAGEVLQIGGVDGALQSVDYVPGVSGWILRGDGTAEIGSLTVRENLAFSNGYYNPDFPTRIFQARPDITCPVVTYVAGYRATPTTGNPNRQTLQVKTGGTVTKQLLMYYGQLSVSPFNTDKSVPNPLVSPLFFGVDMDDWDYGEGEADELHYIARPRRLAVDGYNTFTIEAVVRGWGMMSVWYQIYDFPVWLDGARESMGNRVGPNATPFNAGFTWHYACEMLDSTTTSGYQTLAMAQRVKIEVPKDKCILFAIAPINGVGTRDTTASSDGLYNGFFRVTAENSGNILITEDPGAVDGEDGL